MPGVNDREWIRAVLQRYEAPLLLYAARLFRGSGDGKEFVELAQQAQLIASGEKRGRAMLRGRRAARELELAGRTFSRVDTSSSCDSRTPAR